MIRPITLWPFPAEAFAKAADQVKAFLTVEMSMGQMVEDVPSGGERQKAGGLLWHAWAASCPRRNEILEKLIEHEGGEIRWQWYLKRQKC